MSESGLSEGDSQEKGTSPSQDTVDREIPTAETQKTASVEPKVSAGPTESGEPTGSDDTTVNAVSTVSGESTAVVDVAVCSESERLLSALGYISFLCLLPLLLLRGSEYAQHHGKQALVMAVIFFFLDILVVLPTTYSGLYLLLQFAAVLACAYLAFSGKKFFIPVISVVSAKFNITERKE